MTAGGLPGAAGGGAALAAGLFQSGGSGGGGGLSTSDALIGPGGGAGVGVGVAVRAGVGAGVVVTAAWASSIRKPTSRKHERTAVARRMRIAADLLPGGGA